MSRVCRLAGALLAHTRGEYYLVGNTKLPCDWAAAGFERPPAIDARERPFLRLSPLREIEPTTPCLLLDLEGEELARVLADRFLIERTGSVSERLLRLVLGDSDDSPTPPCTEVSARWLGELPKPVWDVVRDAVLRCS